MIYSNDYHEQKAVASGISKIALRLFPDADVTTVSKLESFAKEAIDLHAYETSKSNRQAINKALVEFQKEHREEMEDQEIRFELVENEDDGDYEIYISHNDKTMLESFMPALILWLRPGGAIRYDYPAQYDADPAKHNGAKKSLFLYGSYDKRPEGF